MPRGYAASVGGWQTDEGAGLDDEATDLPPLPSASPHIREEFEPASLGTRHVPDDLHEKID